MLADEINRATPKTQSALLEAMQEHTVTVMGESHKLSEPFFVLATQNPIEQDGTYPLPEAQMDRFMFKIIVKDPNLSEMKEIVKLTQKTMAEVAEPVCDAEQLLEMRKTELILAAMMFWIMRCAYASPPIRTENVPRRFPKRTYRWVRARVRDRRLFPRRRSAL